MNYEKKYKEALERARKIYNSEFKPDEAAVLAKYLPMLFPEIKDSEDERIRKGIIELVKQSSEILDKQNQNNMIVWLEKQGDKDKLIRELGEYKVKYTQKVLQEDLNKITESQSQPKFKVGDFITNDYCLGKVIEITNDAYLLDTGQGIPFSCEHNAHLWTIEDAKNGDVLATENFIFIFKNIDDGNGVHYYCQYETSKHENDNQFDIALPQSLMGRVGNSILHYSPATKEQRDLLFQKMKEAGYEWNSEKKELKKIEMASKESEDERIRKGLIKAVSGVLKGNTLYGTNVTREEALTWLEKQKGD